MTPTLTELSQFRDFLDERIAARDPLTLEEAVTLWRDESPPWDGLSDVEAIREAVEELRAGERGIPLEQHLAEVRAMIDAGIDSQIPPLVRSSSETCAAPLESRNDAARHRT
jgi:hypothetical protein